MDFSCLMHESWGHIQDTKIAEDFLISIDTSLNFMKIQGVNGRDAQGNQCPARVHPHM